MLQMSGREVHNCLRSLCKQGEILCLKLKDQFRINQAAAKQVTCTRTSQFIKAPDRQSIYNGRQKRSLRSVHLDKTLLPPFLFQPKKNQSERKNNMEKETRTSISVACRAASINGRRGLAPAAARQT
jgi:hypothetical protein